MIQQNNRWYAWSTTHNNWTRRPTRRQDGDAEDHGRGEAGGRRRDAGRGDRDRGDAGRGDAGRGHPGRGAGAREAAAGAQGPGERRSLHRQVDHDDEARRDIHPGRSRRSHLRLPRPATSSSRCAGWTGCSASTARARCASTSRSSGPTRSPATRPSSRACPRWAGSRCSSSTRSDQGARAVQIVVASDQIIRADGQRGPRRLPGCGAACSTDRATTRTAPTRGHDRSPEVDGPYDVERLEDAQQGRGRDQSQGPGQVPDLGLAEPDQGGMETNTESSVVVRYPGIASMYQEYIDRIGKGWNRDDDVLAGARRASTSPTRWASAPRWRRSWTSANG